MTLSLLFLSFHVANCCQPSHFLLEKGLSVQKMKGKHENEPKGKK
jgi:hypothetical protein